jgi:ferredoxin
VRVLIEKAKCRVAACCVMTPAEPFKFDHARRIARVVVAEPSEELRPLAEDAVWSCPVRAISVAVD